MAMALAQHTRFTKDRSGTVSGMIRDHVPQPMVQPDPTIRVIPSEAGVEIQVIATEQGQKAEGHAAWYSDPVTAIAYTAEEGKTGILLVAVATHPDGSKTRMILYVGPAEEVAFLGSCLVGDPESSQVVWQIGRFSEARLRDPKAFARYSPGPSS